MNTVTRHFLRKDSDKNRKRYIKALNAGRPRDRKALLWIVREWDGSLYIKMEALLHCFENYKAAYGFVMQPENRPLLKSFFETIQERPGGTDFLEEIFLHQKDLEIVEWLISILPDTKVRRMLPECAFLPYINEDLAGLIQPYLTDQKAHADVIRVVLPLLSGVGRKRLIAILGKSVLEQYGSLNGWFDRLSPHEQIEFLGVVHETRPGAYKDVVIYAAHYARKAEVRITAIERMLSEIYIPELKKLGNDETEEVRRAARKHLGTTFKISL